MCPLFRGLSPAVMSVLFLSRYNRLCARDYKYKDITIPGGTDVHILSMVLHMDPKYWKDPEVFDPMRCLLCNVSDQQKVPILWHYQVHC